jgi:hypothetical protein
MVNTLFEHCIPQHNKTLVQGFPFKIPNPNISISNFPEVQVEMSSSPAETSNSNLNMCQIKIIFLIPSNLLQYKMSAGTVQQN